MHNLSILVLHSLGDPNCAPAFLKSHVYSLRNTFPQHIYIYHDTALPIPEYVKETQFDAILLDVTFLCARWAPENFLAKIKTDYDFVRQSDSVKIAFPQDQYDCNEILDDWMIEWSVDVVFSVISSNWNVLYPRYHQQGEIKLGYTSYVDEPLIKIARKPFEQRTIDIGYRARKLPPYFGKIGETKWTVGRDVAVLSRQAGLNVDIALGDQGTLSGTAWLDFINNCKFTLGSNSGSSLLDPRGGIQQQVRAYLKNAPDAAFEDIERHCFSGLDGRYSFTAISPRVLEAALLDSCQILVEGAYSGIIIPWEHYIPIRPDASNFAEVLLAMKDLDLVNRLIRNCRDAILDFDDLRQTTQASKVLNLVSDLVEKKRAVSNIENVVKVAAKYQREMPARYIWHWRKIALRQHMIRTVDDYSFLSWVARKSLAAIRRYS